MRNWREFNHHPRANGLHAHTWNEGHTTAHLHGFCYRSAGGMTQRFATVPGRTYRLSFDAYSGSWDGNDTDVVQVMAGDRMQLVHVSEEHHVNPGNPALALPVQMVFNAIGPQTNLSFYADIGHCIDIDNVSVTEVGSGLRSR